MFKTTFHQESLLWTGPERTVIYDPTDTIGKTILRALDGPSRIVQVNKFFFLIFSQAA